MPLRHISKSSNACVLRLGLSYLGGTFSIRLVCEVCQPRPWALCSRGELANRLICTGLSHRILRRCVMNSPQANLDLLVARVQKLEASNRRWRLLNALLLLFGVSVVLMGAKPADRLEPNVIRAGSVEAQDFVLNDEAGHVYARL